MHRVTANVSKEARAAARRDKDPIPNVIVTDLTPEEQAEKQAQWIKWETEEAPKERAQSRLSGLDVPTIRALEEAVDVLIQKGILKQSDFSSLAYNRLQERKQLRTQL